MLGNPWYCKEEILEETSLGIIVDGITDFATFSNQFQYQLKNQIAIIQITKTSSFLFLNLTFHEFKRLKNDFDYSHYQVYSIFLDDAYYDKFIDLFSQTNTAIPIFKEELFYLYFESNNYLSKYHILQNYTDFKIFTKSPPRYICGFTTFSDLLKSYQILIKEGSNWPIFALSHKFIEKFNQLNFKRLNSIQNVYQFKYAHYPPFNRDKKLFYLSFIEKKIRNQKRIQNSEEVYSIREINDVQISHVYKEQVRTFLGFKSLFRCLHVFDYFLHIQKESNSIFDVILIENSNVSKLNGIRYDLFYIEIQNQPSFFDSSLLFTINNVDLVILNSSCFYGFDNQDDFQSALKIFSNSIKIAVEDVRLVDQSEISEKFEKKIAEKMEKTPFIFIVLKTVNNELNGLQTVLKSAKVIEKNIGYRIDNKTEKYILVGFTQKDDSVKTFMALKNLQQSNEIRFFYPEISIKKSKLKIKKHEKKKNLDENDQNYEFFDDIKNDDENYIENENDDEDYIEKVDDEDVQNDDVNYIEKDDDDDVQNGNENYIENDEDDDDDDYDDNGEEFEQKHHQVMNKEKYDQNKQNLNEENNQQAKQEKISQNQQQPKSDDQQQKSNKLNDSLKPSQKNLGPDFFSPNQSLIYLYFIEKPKARKILQGKQVKLTLFGVKKCKDIQRYKKLNEEEPGFFTFFGFDSYEDTTAASKDIKSKWLSETPIKIYEKTAAYIQHLKEPDSIYNDDEKLFIQAINDKKQQQKTQKSKNDEKSSSSTSSINDVKINTYKPFNLTHQFFYLLNQMSVPVNIQLEIKKQLMKSKIVLNIVKDVIPYDFKYLPFTFILVDSYQSKSVKILKDILSHHKIGYSSIDYEYHSHLHYLEFEEKYIPEKVLEEFFEFLELNGQISKIERNIFHNGSIVTIFYFNPSKSEYILNIIQNFFKLKKLLFDYNKYSVKKAIYFNEEILLKKQEDFELIIKEIESIGIHPINIERNKFLFIIYPYENQFLQKLSFICFKTFQDKLKALNHLNSILLKEKTNVMKFNPSLYYLKIDPFKYYTRPDNKDNAWSILSKIGKDMIDVGDFQMKVSSIDSPVDLAYIGFKSSDYLAFYNQLILLRLHHLSFCPNSNFFNPKKNLLYVQFQTIHDVDLLRLIDAQIASRIKDFQKDCIDIANNGDIISYVGFENEQERKFLFFQLTAIIKNPDIVNVMLVNIDFTLDKFNEIDELFSENLLTLFDKYDKIADMHRDIIEHLNDFFE